MIVLYQNICRVFPRMQMPILRISFTLSFSSKERNIAPGVVKNQMSLLSDGSNILTSYTRNKEFELLRVYLMY